MLGLEVKVSVAPQKALRMVEGPWIGFRVQGVGCRVSGFRV